VNAPYARDPARRGEYGNEGRIKRGRIEGRSVRWLADVNPGFTPDYSNILRDSEGYLWVFNRENQRGTCHRSLKPDDAGGWMPATVCIPMQDRHAPDAAALDGGKLYTVSVLTTGGFLYGNLYDGSAWGEKPVLIDRGMTTVAGDDRRCAIEFDPTLNRLHLVYVDGKSILRYRSLDAPYLPEDWSPPLSGPGRELAAGVFTCALSVDSSMTPHDLVITFGREMRSGTDKRERTGELYTRRFGGESWRGKEILVSEPGTVYNWYPNVNRDVRDGLLVMYSRSVDPDHPGSPLAVMVSVGGMGK